MTTATHKTKEFKTKIASDPNKTEAWSELQSFNPKSWQGRTKHLAIKVSNALASEQLMNVEEGGKWPCQGWVSTMYTAQLPVCSSKVSDRTNALETILLASSLPDNIPHAF